MWSKQAKKRQIRGRPRESQKETKSEVSREGMSSAQYIVVIFRPHPQLSRVGIQVHAVIGQEDQGLASQSILRVTTVIPSGPH
eukprot:732280-Amphidinium_carterae.1